MLIFNGVIHTMEGSVLDRGFVRTQGGKILELGSMSACPDCAGGLDARGGHVLPGFVDAHSHIGMFEDGLDFEGDDGNEVGDPITPQLRALDGINPMDFCFQEALRGGVTTVLTGPGSANPIGGQLCAMKTRGRRVDDMLLLEPAGMKFAMGENPKRVYREKSVSPATRMATAALIREYLHKARQYMDKQAAAQPGEEPDFDIKLEALIPVLKGELPAYFHAHRADDMFTALRIGAEFGLRCVLVHGTEGHLAPDLLAQAGVPVITGPNLTDRSKPELKNQSLKNTAALLRAGVLTALCTDHPVIPEQYLPLCADLAAGAGLEDEEALETITINPARIMGLEDRVGSLRPGKDADILLFDAHPFARRARLVKLWINGEEVDLCGK